MLVASQASSARHSAIPTPLRMVFLVCGVTIGWVAVDVVYAVVADTHRLRLLTTYLLPVFAGAVLLAVCRLGRLESGPVGWKAFVAGATFLTAAAGCDLCVTARSDPYLTLEANPYIRVLLDETEHPLGLIYAHVAMTQILFVASFVACWWAFLRHREALLNRIRTLDPRSWLAFAKAATGGGRLTNRQWLLPLNPDEIPDPYFSIWPAALAVIFGTSAFRYWAAAEWLGLANAETSLRIGVLVIGLGGTLAAYYGWLACHWRRDCRGEHQNQPLV